MAIISRLFVVDLFCRQYNQIPESGRNVVIRFATVRNQTVAAVFDPFIVGKITAAVLAESVERAVAEEAKAFFQVFSHDGVAAF